MGSAAAAVYNGSLLKEKDKLVALLVKETLRPETSKERKALIRRAFAAASRVSLGRLQVIDRREVVVVVAALAVAAVVV